MNFRNDELDFKTGSPSVVADDTSEPGDVPAPTRTRRAILNLLKLEGALETADLARRLGLTPMAIRQHLYDLTAEKLVKGDEVARKVGRPAKSWSLTPEANRIFPDAHAELAVNLIDTVEAAFGAEGVERLLAERRRQMVRDYGEGGLETGLERSVRRLAQIRDQEGYMAGVEPLEDGSYLLIENHCPICVAASACRGLCAIELAVFQEVLGEGVGVERTDHIQAGARRCAYRVKAL